MKPIIKIIMQYSTFVQYQPHEYKLDIEWDGITGRDREYFLRNSIEKLTSELINHKTIEATK